MKPEELEALVLQSHKAEILAVLQDKPGVDIRALEKSLDAIIIPVAAPSVGDTLRDTPISVRHREAMEYGFTGTEGSHGINIDTRAERIRMSEGGEVYQIYEYESLPPTKYIENRGLRIRAGAPYEPRYAIEAREQELNHENEVLREEIGKK